MKNIKQIFAVTVLFIAGFGANQAAAAGTDPFIGEIMWTGYNFCPRGWAEADGRLLAISSNTALFSLYGTMYGGDGRTTFALPDLRGRTGVGQGTGPGLTPVREGDYAGAQEVTLTQLELPPHTHPMRVTSQGATTNRPDTDAVLAEARTWDPNTRQLYRNGMYANVAANSTLKSETIGTTGQGKSFSILDPYVGLRPCVALQGIFPSR